MLSADGAGGELDKDALFEDLLSQDRDVVSSLIDSNEDVEGSLEWAWFAGRDVIEVAGGERRKVEQQRREKAEEKSKKATSKKLAKTTSRVAEDVKESPTLTRTSRKQLPDPSVEATRGILDRYLSAIKTSLESAREARLK